MDNKLSILNYKEVDINELGQELSSKKDLLEEYANGKNNSLNMMVLCFLISMGLINLSFNGFISLIATIIGLGFVGVLGLKQLINYIKFTNDYYGLKSEVNYLDGLYTAYLKNDIWLKRNIYAVEEKEEVFDKGEEESINNKSSLEKIEQLLLKVECLRNKSVYNELFKKNELRGYLASKGYNEEKILFIETKINASLYEVSLDSMIRSRKNNLR